MNLKNTTRPLLVALLSFSIAPLLSSGALATQQAQNSKSVNPGEKPRLIEEVGEDPKPIDQYPLAELPPLKRLVLYNSGVGQLQHKGEVEGKQRFEIKFGARDVDDVLKSLVFADEGGGTVRAVEYQPAPEPEDVAASQVGTPMTLAQLIQKFRGEAITLTSGNTIRRGVVYGVENRTEGESIREVVVLLTDEGLQTVDLKTVDRVQFNKEELRNTLNQAMQGIVRSRKANQKQLDLLFDGEGKRNVQFAYVVDMPIWRMTYRLAMNEDKVYLQGWAHVDNVTGVDWKQVEMELRSGKPQSFHVNVFAPMMAERPNFGTGVYEFTEGLLLISDWMEDAIDSWGPSGGGGFGGGIGGGGLGGALGGGGAFGGGRSPAPRPRRGKAGVDIESAFRTAARESRTAQMVRYKLESPVDLGAGRSAALPVFSSEVPASLVSVFDEQEEGVSPFRAVRFKNTTKYSIVSGPLSLMRDGDFVGDGKLGRLDVDQETEIIYGLDRAVEVEVEYGKEETKLIRVELDKKNGIVLYNEFKSEKTFRINNRDTEPRMVVLYVNRPESEKTVIEPKPDQADGRLRFNVEAEERSTKAFPIQYRLESIDRRPLNATNAAALRLVDREEVQIDEAAAKLLKDLIAGGETVKKLRTKRTQVTSEKDQLVASQARLRENLKVLNADSEAAKPFLNKFQELETAIERADSELSDLAAEIVAEEKRQQKLIQDHFANEK